MSLVIASSELSVRRRARSAFAGLLALALGMAAALWGAGPATAAPIVHVEDGISFAADNANVAAGATVTEYDEEAGGLTPVIPDTISVGGQVYDVTHIGVSAFLNQGLTSVTLPSTLLHIDELAFGYNSLSSINIPASVETIGASAFTDNDLIAVTIPNSVETIGETAFARNALTTVTLGTGVTSIGDFAFFINDLGSVVVPDSVISIGRAAFEENSNLTSLTLGSSLETIGDNAFHSASLTSVVIPDSVITIGAGAFYDNQLTALTLGNSLQSIGQNAFRYHSLTALTVPASITSIGIEAFGASSNTLAHVSFLGAAPGTFGPRLGGGSLGYWDATIVHYPIAHQVSGGFATPLWQDYQAVPHPALILNLSGQGTRAPVEVLYGTVPTLPSAASATGWIFEGWFLDEELTVPAVLGDPLLADLTLYAAWSADPSALSDTGADESLALMLSGGGILLVGVGALLVLRRQRAEY